MGLREKVTITLVIIALIQIACRHCMPRTPRKASLKRYLNDLKPVKNNPTPTPYSPSRLNKATKQTFGKTAQNGRISQKSLPKQYLYQTYKFPEMEFPLDNSPRDPFHIGMNFNDNNHVSTLQSARNLQSSAINDLKKEMKMKRKLLSNKQMNSENSPLKTEISPIKFTSYPDSMHLLDSESFPEVQYPLNTMDTWGTNSRSYLPLIQEKQLNRYGQQTLNRQAKEDIKKPFSRLTKAKASKYLQSYDKLKEEQRRTSTENSKRSNVGQKGLNFTKTATCEKTSDDFMIAGLVSNNPSNPTELKRPSEPFTEIKPSSENTCPVTEYANHYMPIPYRVFENNTENMCAFEQKNTTKELQDVDTSVIAQTLQLIEEILFHDDHTSSEIPTGHYSKEIEINVNSSDCTDVPTNKTTLMVNTKNFTDCPAEEISQEVSDDAPSGILQENMLLIPEDILAKNPTAVEGPLSARMPLKFSEPIEFEAVTNASERGRNIIAPIANSNAVPGPTSIIIIPINNSDGKSLPHILETTTGTPIIVYLPSTQNSGVSSQTQHQIVSSLLDNSVPNNELYNVLSNVAPLQNDNPSCTALVSELLNSISDSGSSLPIYETLPTNSMCYNNESSPSSMKEKPVSEILIHKSLTDDAPIRTTICDVKLPEQPTETVNFVMNTETLPPTPDFEHPLFDFAGSEFSSLSHGPYNNVLKNELPILTREINSYQQISNVASKDLFIPIQNVTSEYLHTNISYNALPEITNDAPTVAMNQIVSFESPTDSLPDTIIINDMPPTPLTVTTVEKPLPMKTSLSLNPLPETLYDNSDSNRELMGTKVPPTLIGNTDNMSSRSPVVNKSPMTSDMSIKTELFKIRKILDKMLSSEIPQTTPMVSILSPISDTDNLLMLVKASSESTQTPIDSVFMPAVEKTDRPLPGTDSPINNLGLQVHETHSSVPADRTSSDTLRLPVDKSLIPSLLLDTADSPPLLIDETVPPTPVFENPADKKSYLINNLVTTLSETRTKYTPKNNFSRTTDGVPSKMDSVIPNIHELSSNELLFPVADSPIIVLEEPTTNTKSKDSTTNLPMQIVEPQNSHSNVPLSDLLYITKELSIPEVLEASLPDISSESQTTTKSGYTNKLQQDCWPSTVLNSSQEEKKQVVELPLSIIPDVSPGTFANEPFSPNDSPSPTNAKIEDFPHTGTDTEDFLSVEDHLLSSEDHANPDTLVTNSPSTVSLSTSLDKSSDEELSEYTFSDLPRDDLILTDNTDNTSTDLPLPINKTSTTSNLSIAKALLENVLSDITKKGLSSSVTRPPPVTPSSILDKTEYQVDVESPTLESQEIPPAEQIFPKSEASTNFPNPEKPEDILPIPVDKTQVSVTSHLDISTKDLALKMEEIIPTDDIEKCFSPQNRTKTLLSDNPVDVLLPTDKVPPPFNTLDRNPLSNKNTLPASKLLENVLSDVTTKGFSLPVASMAFPMKSTSELDRTFYYLEFPLSDLTAEISSPSEIPPVNENISSTIHSDQPTDNNLPFSGQFSDTLPLEIDTTLAEISSLNIPSATPMNEALLKFNVDMKSSKAEILPTDTPGDLPSSTTKTHSSSKLPIAKALLQNVLSDVTSKSFSLPVHKVLPMKSSSVLDKSVDHLESPLCDPTEGSVLPSVSEIKSGTTHSDHLTDNNLYFSGQSEHTLPLVVDKTLSEESNLDTSSKMSSLLDKSNANISSPKAENFPKGTPGGLPLSDTKTILSSKLPIAKALLKNGLSDVTSRSFSLPVSKVLPVKSSSVLDETLYYVESPLSNPTKESEIISSTTLADQTTNNNLPFFEPSENVLPLEEDKMHSEVSSLEIATKISSLMDNVEPKSNLDTSSPKTEILHKDTSSDPSLLTTKTHSSSKLPIAKALLQNVLSDVTSKSFSLPVSKVLPVKSSSVLDETLYYVESPLSNPTIESEIISSTTLADQTTNNNLPFSEPSENILPLEEHKMLSEVSSLEIPTKISSLMDNLELKSNLDTSSPKTEILPKDTSTDPSLPTTKTHSSSKLPIAKALLQNVLSDVTSKSFSLPVSKVLPVKSSSVLDETLYYVESPLSEPTEASLLSSVNDILSNTALPHQPANSISGQSEETLSLEKFSEVSSLDIPSDTSSLMEKSDVEISSPQSEMLPKDASSDPPLSNTKTISSSKLLITKALLENVLSDIKTTGFSVPVTKSLPVESRSQLDKTLYYMDSSLSDWIEKSSPSNLPSSEINENVFEQSLEKIFTVYPNLDVPIDLPIDQIAEDRSDNLTEDIEDEESNETFSDNPLEDTDDLPKWVDEQLSFFDNMSNDLRMPQNKRLFASRIPITKALLEKVLSDINDGGIRP